MKKLKIGRKLVFVVSSFLALAYVFPFLLVLINSFKPKREILENTLALPIEFDLDNFTMAIRKMNYFQSLTNSIIITVVSVASLIVASSILAYYLARRPTKLSKSIFLVLVASMIVPFQSLMVPFIGFYGQNGPFAAFNMLSQYGLVFFYVGFGVAMTTFLYHGFISNIPVELDEAAKLDGATDMTIFRKIIFPMLTPVTATVAIINSLWIWNDFLLPSMVLIPAATKTLPLSTYIFYGMYSSNYGQAMAGLLLSVLPIIIFYFMMQKQILSGMSAGAVK
jgi:raffinose/stachyose/melibiose transport system permease protein